ncbi:MAG: hypothetical protein HYY39_05085, partial [Armatimonadetes bacterium]|nr:hypothetical protein [Armatimonadota bacterium]
NCCLGSLNLLTFVQQPFAQLPIEQNVDWAQLRRAVRAGIRFLDDVVAYADPLFPLEAQRNAARRTRRVGLGVTGLGDMLIALRLRYDTEEAIGFAGRLMEFIKIESYRASVDLAREKGSFSAFEAEPHLAQEFLHELPSDLREQIARSGLRNAATMTVPPVGSGAALAGVTSGIEPMFALAYLRRSESLSQERFWVLHPLAVRYWKEFVQKPMPTDTDRFVEEAHAELPDFFVTAHEMDPLRRVRMQAAISKHVDNAVSSTINLPRDTTVEQVGQLYFEAWRYGLKGVTIYREGSREGILITVQEAKSASFTASQPTTPQTQRRVTSPRPRPKVTAGRTERVETPRGRIYVVVNEDERGVCEVFVHSFDVEAEACGRLASLALRAGVDPREVIEQLWRVQSKEVAFDRSSNGTVVRVTTIAQAIALALGRALYGDDFRPDKEFPRADALPVPAARVRQEALKFDPEKAVAAGGNGEPAVTANGEGNGDVERVMHLEFVGICPDCGESLVHENGCANCRSCGYARC